MPARLANIYRCKFCKRQYHSLVLMKKHITDDHLLKCIDFINQPKNNMVLDVIVTGGKK